MLDTLSYEEGFEIKPWNAWRCVGAREANAIVLNIQEVLSRREGRCILCCLAEDNKYQWKIGCSISFLQTDIYWAPTTCKLTSGRERGCLEKQWALSQNRTLQQSWAMVRQGCSEDNFCLGWENGWDGLWNLLQLLRACESVDYDNFQQRNTKGVPANPTLPQFLPQT